MNLLVRVRGVLNRLCRRQAPPTGVWSIAHCNKLPVRPRRLIRNAASRRTKRLNGFGGRGSPLSPVKGKTSVRKFFKAWILKPP